MTADSNGASALDARLRDFEETLSYDPDDVSTLRAYGEASLLRGRLHAALKSFQRLVTLQPELVEHRLALARAYLESDLREEARAHLLHVQAASPNLIELRLLMRRLTDDSDALSDAEADDASFVPDREALEHERARLDAAVRVLDSEIDQMQETRAASPADLAHEFSIRLAHQRRERMLETLTLVERWRQRCAPEVQGRGDAPTEPAGPAQDVRESAYRALEPQLAAVTSALLKANKGVRAALLVDRAGTVVHATGAPEVPVETLARFVVEVQPVLADASEGEAAGRESSPWRTWVLECVKGILVLHRVTGDFVLVIYGQTGANFGLLTLFIDKNRAQMESILSGAPPVA